MRNIFYLLAVTSMIMVSCQSKTVPVPVDVATEEAAVNVLIDQLYVALETQDASILNTSLTDDMLACGSDPSEFWNKQQVIELWTAMLAEMSPEVKRIGNRVVRIAQDGHSALAVEQYLMPVNSSKIPLRNTYHLVKSNGEWKIFLLNTAFIPKNEEIPILDAALSDLVP